MATLCQLQGPVRRVAYPIEPPKAYHQTFPRITEVMLQYKKICRTAGMTVSWRQFWMRIFHGSAGGFDLR